VSGSDSNLTQNVTCLIWTLISWPFVRPPRPLPYPKTCPNSPQKFFGTLHAASKLYCLRKPLRRLLRHPPTLLTPRNTLKMDDHHDQPIWPMIQGAANYGWNLIEEALAMIWKPAVAPQAQAMGARPECKHQSDGEMREVTRDVRVSKKLHNEQVLQHDQAG
jgi:hypothetical protein